MLRRTIVPFLGSVAKVCRSEAVICVNIIFLFSSWIDPASDDTFKKFGGMRYLLYNDTLRVISINTVMYHVRNDHFKHDSDPCGQFQWLDGFTTMFV
jgi:hypothetical protein